VACSSPRRVAVGNADYDAYIPRCVAVGNDDYNTYSPMIKFDSTMILILNQNVRCCFDFWSYPGY
jgi:hypothetical protein